MFKLTGRGGRLCDGIGRREILRIGGLGAFGGGLALADLLASRAEARVSTPKTESTRPVDRLFGRAKSCIVLFLMGGPDQHSTWDPKPEAPAEVRGPYKHIDTKTPGVAISELMPKLSRMTDKLCILRAMSTGDDAHSSSGYYMLTGVPHQPMNFENANPGAPNDHPVLGAVVGKLVRSRGGLPACVTLPHHIFNTDGSVWPGQDAGFLGRSGDPWKLNVKPSKEGPKVDEISLPAGLDPTRLAGRKGLLDQIRAGIDTIDRDSTSKLLDDRARQAFELLLSSRARDAFRTELEPAASRARYGDSPFGQDVMLARRLIEAGVRLVQVNWYRGADEPPDNPCWDTHKDEPARLKNVLVPPVDFALSTLIDDLSTRGLLDETLVVCMSEFGRSPKLEGNAGRGHWGKAFSIALAGGGIRGGFVHGSTDRNGAYPRDGKVKPEDLAATIYHCLGIRADTTYLDPLDRPHPVSRGEVVQPLLG
jgi:hypothetical protein